MEKDLRGKAPVILSGLPEKGGNTMKDVYKRQAYWEAPVKRRARLNGLMHMILSRMARGDMEGAARALQRARRAPFQAPYALSLIHI